VLAAAPPPPEPEPIISTAITALPDAVAGITKLPEDVNSSYFRTPPLAPIVVHAGTPAAMPSTWLAVPMPNRATVAEPEAYRMSPSAVTVSFGIAVPAKS
jgi:hypothetical protein